MIGYLSPAWLGVSSSQATFWALAIAAERRSSVMRSSERATVIEPPTKGQGARRVWSDSKGRIWVSEWNSGNAIVRFDPVTEKFHSFPSSEADANVRQMLGRPGEAWGAESGADRLVVVTQKDS